MDKCHENEGVMAEPIRCGNCAHSKKKRVIGTAAQHMLGGKQLVHN